MAKKYKNTVHKNPFRENRPKKNVPWKLIGILSAFLALIIVLTLIIKNTVGTRKLTLADNGGFYDKRSGITYQLAPMNYQPVTILTNEVYASYKAKGSNYTTKLYKIKDADAEKVITTDEDGLYDVYYNEKTPLPTLLEMKAKYAYVCAVGEIAYPVGNLSEEESKQMTERLFDDSLQCERPENIDSESIRYIYFGSEDYPYLYYYIHCFKTADGARYIWDRTSERCVPLGDAFSGILD